MDNFTPASGEHLKPKFESSSQSPSPTPTTPRGKTEQPSLPEGFLSLLFCKPQQRIPPWAVLFLRPPPENHWWPCGSSLRRAPRNLSVSSCVLDIPQSQGCPVCPLGCTASSPASPSASTPRPRDRLELEVLWGHFPASVTPMVLNRTYNRVRAPCHSPEGSNARAPPCPTPPLLHTAPAVSWPLWLSLSLSVRTR